MIKFIIILFLFFFIVKRVLKGNCDCVFESLFKIKFMCLWVDKVFVVIWWCLNVLVWVIMLFSVINKFFMLMLGNSNLCLLNFGIIVLVIKILWFLWGILLRFLVVFLNCLYFCKCFISLVCGFFFFLSFLCFGSNNFDLICVNKVVMIRYLLVSLSWNLFIILI